LEYGRIRVYLWVFSFQVKLHWEIFWIPRWALGTYWKELRFRKVKSENIEGIRDWASIDKNEDAWRGEALSPSLMLESYNLESKSIAKGLFKAEV